MRPPPIISSSPNPPPPSTDTFAPATGFPSASVTRPRSVAARLSFTSCVSVPALRAASSTVTFDVSVTKPGAWNESIAPAFPNIDVTGTL